VSSPPDFANNPTTRISIALVLSSIVCVSLLGGLAGWLAMPSAPPAPPTTIDMQLVELPPPAPPEPARPQAPPSAPKAAPPKAVAPPPKAQTTVKPDVTSPPAPPLAQAVPATESAPPAPSAAPAPEAKAAPSASSAGPANDSASSDAHASGTSAAYATIQPLPVVPDDMREEAYQAVAMARFKIHADGSVDVTLIQPTQNPRMNQILLKTLRGWRFFPSMQDGHPVESSQDVRVHFNVN
jgi:protein TonB